METMSIQHIRIWPDPALKETAKVPTRYTMMRSVNARTGNKAKHTAVQTAIPPIAKPYSRTDSGMPYDIAFQYTRTGRTTT